MKIETQVSRRLVPVEGSSEHYLRVIVKAPESSGPNNRLPLNIALIIDRSGSMAGSKLENAKEAAIFCLRNLTSADRVAVISYDDEVRVVAPSRTLTPEAKTQLISEVRGIHSGGSTNLGGGWLTGAQEVANHQHEANYLSRAILLSDGLANVGIIDTGELAHHASELRKRGISTTTMGIGADFNEELLEQMAIKGGGHFYFIEQPAQIPDLLHRELGEVLSTMARAVSLELTVPEEVEATLLNSFEVTKRGSLLTARLDDMIAGEVRTLLFKLSCPHGVIGSTVPLVVGLAYTDVDTGQKREIRNNEAMLTYAEATECQAERPNPEVVEEAALLRAALAREEALRYDAEGRYDMSAASLAGAASHLRMVAPASPMAMAEANALESDSSEAEGGFNAIKRKAIHYTQSARRQSRQE